MTLVGLLALADAPTLGYLTSADAGLAALHGLLPGGLWLAADWTEVIVPAVVFVVWIINQIAGAAKKGKAQAARRPAPPAAAGGGAGGPAQPGQRGLMDEVEQFLRQARQSLDSQAKAKPQQPKKPPAQQANRGNAPKQKQANRGNQQGKRKGEGQGKQAAPARPRLSSEGERDLGGSVARHVEEHLNTSRFAERAGQLSHLKQQVEHDIGGHVRGAFDHQVGTLAVDADIRGNETGSQPALTTDVFALLRDPQGMRNAMILQEILAPPTHRW